MEKARLAEVGKRGVGADAHDWGRNDAAFFKKGKALRARRDSDDESDNFNPTDDDDSDASAAKKKPKSTAKPKSQANQAALPIKRLARKHGRSGKPRAKPKGGQ
jgi:hypothetical protein